MGDFDTLATGQKAGHWKDTLDEAIKDAYQQAKEPGKSGPQYLRLEQIQFWGENPVREYRAIVSSIPPPG